MSLITNKEQADLNAAFIKLMRTVGYRDETLQSLGFGDLLAQVGGSGVDIANFTFTTDDVKSTTNFEIYGGTNNSIRFFCKPNGVELPSLSQSGAGAIGILDFAAALQIGPSATQIDIGHAGIASINLNDSAFVHGSGGVSDYMQIASGETIFQVGSHEFAHFLTNGHLGYTYGGLPNLTWGNVVDRQFGPVSNGVTMTSGDGTYTITVSDSIGAALFAGSAGAATGLLAQAGGLFMYHGGVNIFATSASGISAGIKGTAAYMEQAANGNFLIDSKAGQQVLIGYDGTSFNASLIQLYAPVRTSSYLVVGSSGGAGSYLQLTGDDISVRPAAAAPLRGAFWYAANGAGVADTLTVCMKSAGDTYSWKTITTG